MPRATVLTPGPQAPGLAAPPAAALARFGIALRRIAAPASLRLESWSDADHDYFEAELPAGLAVPDLDLCVQDGRLFVRVAHATAAPSPE